MPSTPRQRMGSRVRDGFASAARPFSAGRAPRGTRRRRWCRRPGTRPSAASPAACGASARSATSCRATRASRSAGARRQHTSTECFDTPAVRRVAPEEPLRVVEAHADADRVRALARRLDPGGAPVRAVAGVGVLVVRVEVVVLVEHDAARPPPAAHLPLDRTEPIGREVHVVVLVRLRDRARLVHLEEVHRDAEVHGREVREAVRGGLVRHRVRVAQVLDRDRARGPSPPAGTAPRAPRGSAARRSGSSSRRAGGGTPRSSSARGARGCGWRAPAAPPCAGRPSPSAGSRGRAGRS